MKKLFLSALAFLFILCCPFLLVSCAQKNPCIKVATIETTYYIGDDLNLSSAYIKYYSDISNKKYDNLIAITEDMISGFSTQNVGTFTMTITYENLTTTVSYTVLSNGPYIVAEGLKTNYEINESLSLTQNSKIKYYSTAKDNIFTEHTITSDMITGFSTQNAGTFTMTITYEGLTTTISYTVLINDSYIVAEGLKTTYEINESLHLDSNSKIKYYLNSRTENFTEYTIAPDMISGFSTQNAGTFTMTITYEGLTTTLSYTVLSNDSYIVAEGLKTTYEINEPLHLDSNSKIKYYLNSRTETFTEHTITSDMITGFSTQNAGTFIMIITFNGVSVSQQYTVNEQAQLEEQALLILTNALQNSMSSQIIKEDIVTPIMSLTTITTRDIIYTNESLFSSQSWTKKENGVWYSYDVTTYNNDSYYQKSRKVMLVDDARQSLFSDIDIPTTGFESVNIEETQTQLILSFEVYDNYHYTSTFYIENNKIKKMETIADSISYMTIEFSYDTSITIPNIPTNVTWDVVEYNPYIEVVGIKENYIVGEEINLTNAIIEFYINDDTFFPDEYELTSDMIAGFSTQNAGTFTMTITFYGISVEKQYTVSNS